MRVLVSGGGTGGHINPALAIADKIKSMDKSAVIEYVGTPAGMENNLVPKAGYKIHHVKVRGFKRSLSPANFDAAIKAVTSVFVAKKIIKKFKPDVVIGTGGYVSWPVLKAASKLGIPTCIHEQNAYPGVTTRMLSKYVDKVMISFDESRPYFDCDKEKLVLVGNPVSQKMLDANKEKAREKLGISPEQKVILSAGGSLGAKPINDNAFELIKNYSLKENTVHFHATGKAGWEEESARYVNELVFEKVDDETLKRGNVTVCKYVYNMHELLAACDVEICRAGAMTLSELAVLGKAAVIIPSPYVTNNHQYENAKVLCDKGAAVMIQEKDLNGEKLVAAVKELLENDEKRSLTENNVRGFAVTDSLDRIYSIVKEIVKK